MITEATTEQHITLDTDELISLKDDIMEQIGIAASIWDWTEFEENALNSLISDIFQDRGIL